MSGILCRVIQVYSLVIIARILLEWLQVPPDHPVAGARRVLRAVTDPILAPFRRLIPPINAGGVGIDLSPIVVLVALGIIGSVICS
ncbi:MAG: YggT family protein [Actinobacteria bacterium]|nr:YggT family protein [Actinomycetota bacterium]MBU1492914.1 YggT family protein [Actinomycetota bacterium]